MLSSSNFQNFSPGKIKSLFFTVIKKTGFTGVKSLFLTNSAINCQE